MMTVGQKLYFVPRDRRVGSPRTVEVIHIGRKWATLNGENATNNGSFTWTFGRCDKVTGIVDGKGYSSPGTCWVSREAYESDNLRLAAWEWLRASLQARARPPRPDVTIDDIHAAAKLLGIEDNKK